MLLHFMMFAAVLMLLHCHAVASSLSWYCVHCHTMLLHCQHCFCWTVPGLSHCTLMKLRSTSPELLCFTRAPCPLLCQLLISDLVSQHVPQDKYICDGAMFVEVSAELHIGQLQQNRFRSCFVFCRPQGTRLISLCCSHYTAATVPLSLYCCHCAALSLCCCHCTAISLCCCHCAAISLWLCLCIRVALIVS